MHKKLFIFFFLISLCLNFISAYDSQSYSSCGGDTQATVGCIGDAQLFFSGNIAEEPQSLPELEIEKPRNETYIKGNGMKVEIETNSEDVWYNLDNGENKTIPPSNIAVFNTDNGLHTIYVFANNSVGLISKNVTFTVNNTKFSIHHDDYEGSDRGESTNLSEYSYEEVQNISNVILEKTGKGKIKFNQNINFTDDLNPEDEEINLDSHITISSNRIEINSTALPNFNKSATLSLYDLTFINPRILMNGEICPDSVCAEGSYSGGTLEFNVTHFTVFSTEEAPVAVTDSPVQGGTAKPKHECELNSDCSQEGEYCWKNSCVKLFDIKILDFESPAKVKDFFDFTYFLKGMADINGDVIINFWIENSSQKITSGSDTIYLGAFEEKTETTKIFLPGEIESGVYEFVIEVTYGEYKAGSSRTIEIDVNGDSAQITFLNRKRNIFLYSLIGIILLMLVLYAIFIIKKHRKTPEEQETEEIEEFPKEEKMPKRKLTLKEFKELSGIEEESVQELIEQIKTGDEAYKKHRNMFKN